MLSWLESRNFAHNWTLYVRSLEKVILYIKRGQTCNHLIKVYINTIKWQNGLHGK